MKTTTWLALLAALAVVALAAIAIGMSSERIGVMFDTMAAAMMTIAKTSAISARARVEA